MSGRQQQRDALKRVAAVLKAAEVPFAVAGGYAAWAHGAPEPDHDADVVVDAGALDAARQALHAAGIELRDPPEDWLVKAYVGGRLVDVIHHLSGDRPVGAELLGRAELCSVDSLTVPVLAATDVLVTKLRALSEHSCDFTRLLPVARALREQVHWDRVRREVADNPYALAFCQLTAQLGISPG